MFRQFVGARTHRATTCLFAYVCMCVYMYAINQSINRKTKHAQSRTNLNSNTKGYDDIFAAIAKIACTLYTVCNTACKCMTGLIEFSAFGCRELPNNYSTYIIYACNGSAATIYFAILF